MCGHLLRQPRETCTSPPGPPQWTAISPEFKPGMRALRNNRPVILSITYPDKVTLGPKPGLSQDLDPGLRGTLRPGIPLPGDRRAEGSHGHMPRCPTLGPSGRRRRPPILLSPHCAAGWPLLLSQHGEPHPRLPLVSAAKPRPRVQPLCPAPYPEPHMGPLLPTPISLQPAPGPAKASSQPLYPPILLPATPILASPPLSHEGSTSTLGLWARSCVTGPFQNHGSGSMTCMGE